MAASLNRYHHRINIPVPFVFPTYQVPDPRSRFHRRFDKKDMNVEIVTWIHSLGLYIVTGEYFYTPPNETLEPHSDSPFINDVVKLNWMKGGEGSDMEWFQLKEGAMLRTNTTVINTQYSFAPREDLIKVHSATIGTPSLVNVGQIHGIQNKDRPRFVACLVIAKNATRSRVTWDEALDIFGPYVDPNEC
jgi:hypothetical protein